ncbi:MAG: sigma-70 family RNA polymerase sigma factor [Victivallales bacterium]|nr:sigma-70 family RNA polymerase sigma factor [Victivallales bacterium]
MKTVTADDRKLIAEFKSGNKKVFEVLVETYSAKLFQVAYGLLGSHEDAEEVVQDAFVRAFRALDKFRGESSLETWLHRIVVNLSRNRYHWNRRRGSELNLSISGHMPGLDDSDNPEDMSIPDESQTPDGQLENNELECLVEKGIEDLPDNVRETMILRHVREMSYDDIAATLQCKIGTVKSRIARGREMLRLILGHADPGRFTGSKTR